MDAASWLDAPGLPTRHWQPASERLERVRQLAGRVPTAAEGQSFTPTEWQLFLESTPSPLPLETCRALDNGFALTASKNPDVLVAWLTLATQSGDAAVLTRVEEVLGRFGRLKYLKPLYRALLARPETQSLARKVFERERPRYHPIAQQVVQGLLEAANR